MKKGFSVLSILALLIVSACSTTSMRSADPVITQDTFITLADVTGQTRFIEDSPDIRVIGVKAKAMIKKENQIEARKKALENAGTLAVDVMIRELMSAETYNRNYEAIERYFKQNVNKFIEDSQIDGERKIFNDRFIGIAASFKVSRQKTLVALQKDLRLIDATRNSLITVITSEKNLDLSAIGFRFSDLEDALMNQIQTDLNQRGLKAMDFRNAVVSMQTDEKSRKMFTNVSKSQFMAMVAGSKAGEARLNEQIQEAEAFYSAGLSLLKQLARVVVEVNVLSLNKKGNVMVLNLGVTARNISVGTGGAFANTIVQVARQAGPGTDDSAMLTGLITDAYQEMDKQFIPQVIKEMSTIDAGGNKLARYELVLRGFSSREQRLARRAIETSQTDSLRYINYDNTLRDANPPIIRLFVRYSGKTSQLGDRILDILDAKNISAEDPIVAPGLTDLVFEKMKEDN